MFQGSAYRTTFMSVLEYNKAYAAGLLFLIDLVCFW